jgi:vaccinia related kinase
MPCCHGFGSAIYADQRLRFVVIDRLGSDLEKFFQSGEKPFPLVTALRVALQVLDTLEFIHSKSYVHNDIKAQNLLLGLSSEQADNVYLVDFGLACKYRYDKFR